MSILEKIFRFFLREVGGVNIVYISNKTSFVYYLKEVFWIDVNLYQLCLWAGISSLCLGSNPSCPFVSCLLCSCYCIPQHICDRLLHILYNDLSACVFHIRQRKRYKFLYIRCKIYLQNRWCVRLTLP